MESNSPIAHSPNEHVKTDRSDMFHVSIAWNLTEPEPELVSLVQDIKVDKYVHSPQAAFDVVKARVGNAVHNFDLVARKSSLGTRRGSLGLG